MLPPWWKRLFRLSSYFHYEEKDFFFFTLASFAKSKIFSLSVLLPRSKRAFLLSPYFFHDEEDSWFLSKFFTQEELFANLFLIKLQEMKILGRNRLTCHRWLLDGGCLYVYKFVSRIFRKHELKTFIEFPESQIYRRIFTHFKNFQLKHNQVNTVKPTTTFSIKIRII